MKIKNLELINFRNYDHYTVEFNDNNLIIGNNGTGKTSILEAVNILATARSPITHGINKCIKHGQKGFIISGNFEKDNHETVTIIFRQEKDVQRVIKINDVVLKKSSELLGQVNSVIFLPNDIDLIQGTPQGRRKYLDIVISQLNSHYYELLQQEAVILKQRNALLKAIREKRQPENMLDGWDEQLLNVGLKIFEARREKIKILGDILSRYYGSSGFNQKVELVYKTQFSANQANNKQELLDRRRFDIISGTTSFGVHRDDIQILCNKLPAAEFCSQGQQRLLVVCLKLAEAELKKNEQGEPLLLVDDVLLELDLERFNKLLKETLGVSQKIFTVTDTARFEAEILTQLNQIKLD
jgi:DNA replication and repair protein RecF